MADPYNQNPFAPQLGGATNSFENWYNQYYGGNNSGYQPQKRLSDLAYQQPQPRQFSYTNADFSPPQQQMYQAPVQQQSQQVFYDPGYAAKAPGGTVYKASPESNTEYYSGDDKDAYYRSFMRRKGYGSAIDY